MSAKGSYYLPEPSAWPIVTSAGMFLLALGLILTINSVAPGSWIMLAGFAVIVYMMIRWFGQVITESEAGSYNDQVDMSFRLGMGWFIGSEVMFFAAFFGALFYIRQFSVPWLGSGLESELLWKGFESTWPTAGPQGPVALPPNSHHVGENQFSPMGAMGIPFINTMILLSSGVTVTWAHWGLKKDNRAQLITGLFLTVALGITFLSLQAYEYVHAYTELGLTLQAGVYGATFFMLTGFHGLHVTMGTIMLIVILGRSIKGHFSAEHHFGFEGVAWYWHFVDVVWLGLFIFVYWL
ncbi:MAG: cytochrome c oxidase subunit 3 [Acidiferrobacterales bacterium]|jgi:cytochrome c oxidase subunit 3|nr:cytochrome c oxidase subunit 3 [Acidiferrobacterales bacterium]